MPYQQNTKPAPNLHFVPLDRVKYEIIGVTGQNTEFYVGICTRAQEMHQNAANQSNFQSFKPFHLELSGTINGTVAFSGIDRTARTKLPGGLVAAIRVRLKIIGEINHASLRAPSKTQCS